MNENIDLTKILKNCPKGTKLYSTILGDVKFCYIDESDAYPIKLNVEGECDVSVTADGKHYVEYGGECTLFPSREQRDWDKFTAPWYKKEKSVEPKFKAGDMVRHKDTNKDDVYEISKVYDDSYGIAGFNWMILMKYQDQYELVHNKFDPKTLKPFDKVITKFSDYPWKCDIFSYYVERENKSINCYCTSEDYVYDKCIPYNDETKHLVGTNDEAPEFYRYWED